MLTNVSIKKEARKKRHRSIRKRISGTPDRPRLAIFRSTRHIYAQVIDDLQQKTLVSTSSLSLGETQGGQGQGDDGEADKKAKAKKVGALIAQKCKERGIDKVVFDRAGYKYHGRISALADGAREAGLKF